MLCRPVLLREAHGDWVDSTILVLRFTVYLKESQ